MRLCVIAATFFLCAGIALLLIVPDIGAAPREGKRKRGSRSSPKASQSLEQRKDDLARLQQSIKEIRQQVASLSTKETSVSKKLSVLKRQETLLLERTRLIEGELGFLQDSLARLQRADSMTRQRLAETRLAYSSLLLEYQKARSKSHPMQGPQPLLEAENAYLRLMTRRLGMLTTAMQRAQDSIVRRTDHIAQTSKEREELLRQTSDHKSELQSNIQSQRRTLENIQNDKTALASELKRKRQAVVQMTNLVNSLVEMEERRERERKQEQERRQRLAEREQRARDNSAASTKEDSRQEGRRSESGRKPARDEYSPPSSNFSGRFRWPVSSRKILRGFGSYTNPVTNTVMENPGLDVKTPSGTAVYSAADGVVSLVHWLFGYNTVVIIDHGNGYRTVYANLETSAVSKSQRVSTGTRVGTSTHSVDGEFVHFEIWKNRQRQNPLKYLR